LKTMSYMSPAQPTYGPSRPSANQPVFGTPRHASLSGAYVPSQSTSHSATGVPLYPPYPSMAASMGSTPAVNPSFQAYQQAPYHPSSQPRSMNNPAYADIYPSLAAMPSVPVGHGQSFPHTYSGGVSSYPPRGAPNTISLYESDDELPSPTQPPMLLSDPSPSPTNTDSMHSSNHRRHPFHPEGTPQPKGRGARKLSKGSEDNSKTLHCDGCDALFARKHDLDRHRRIHTLEAPYLCRGCMRSYRRSDARKRHWDQEPACAQMHIRKTSEKPYPI